MNTLKVVDYIVKWLKDYAESSKMNGFVVGVSGGIDSAVTSALCAKTGLPVLCVEMPIYQAESQVSRAKLHIENLKKSFPNVSSTTFDLSGVFNTFKNQDLFDNDHHLLDLSLANTRARLRMTTLYYFAGLKKYLVAGTGNKVEDFGVGFYTKYGDGGVDLSPIADLMKSEVYALGKLLEVTKSIINAAPTDGLFGDNRTDEDQIGASYDELEWAMKMNDLEKSSEDFEGREKIVFDLFLKLNSTNKHKMIPIPICKIPKDILS
ncbi:MAG: NAD(+) synthase [Flavobacteriaceae bacterium]|nr:NAD(+) synthase [Flavobacteriaceae bacterium]MDG1791227.1 NAD(+) synthase [Flavobacteriaceae bacterium]MDG2447384.1 NAD(+) synthase [Flavobacteriaceae bacterium]